MNQQNKTRHMQRCKKYSVQRQYKQHKHGHGPDEGKDVQDKTCQCKLCPTFWPVSSQDKCLFVFALLHLEYGNRHSRFSRQHDAQKCTWWAARVHRSRSTVFVFQILQKCLMRQQYLSSPSYVCGWCFVFCILCSLRPQEHVHWPYIAVVVAAAFGVGYYC